MTYKVKYTMDNGTEYSKKPLTETITDLATFKSNLANMPSAKLISIKTVA